jgi:hypothetical protein
MKKLALALLVAALAVTGAHAQSLSPRIDDSLYVAATFSPQKDQSRIEMAQADANTTSVQTSAPVTSTTVVKGGNLAAEILQWVQVAFGTTIGAAILWAFVRGLAYMGIKITSEQKDQLQAIIINGLNAAAAKAQTDLRSNQRLDMSVKSKIVADAVAYTQAHGEETIKALGLEPNSGEAIEAIRARIETALNDPNAPTPPAITPSTGQPLAPAVVATAQPLAPKK